MMWTTQVTCSLIAAWQPELYRYCGSTTCFRNTCRSTHFSRNGMERRNIFSFWILPNGHNLKLGFPLVLTDITQLHFSWNNMYLKLYLIYCGIFRNAFHVLWITPLCYHRPTRVGSFRRGIFRSFLEVPRKFLESHQYCTKLQLNCLKRYIFTKIRCKNEQPVIFRTYLVSPETFLLC